MDKDYLLKKWLNNDLNAAEAKAFAEKDDFEFNQQIINDAKLFKASQFSTVGDYNDFKRNTSGKSNRIDMRSLNSILRIAAVLVIGIGIYFAFFNTSTMQFETIAGEKFEFSLPDQSLVSLNALSSIEFNKKNWSDDRSLELKGEAYFKVAKGSVFNVQTADGEVTVLGTQFTVKQRQDYFEVKCFEGVVQVTSIGNEIILNAGESFRMINDNSENRSVDLKEPEWLNNKSMFQAVPLFEVLAEMERQYDIQITIENMDANRLFTGGFMHDNLNNALISITQPMNLSFEIITSNQVKINGEKK